MATARFTKPAASPHRSATSKRHDSEPRRSREFSRWGGPPGQHERDEGVPRGRGRPPHHRNAINKGTLMKSTTIMTFALAMAVGAGDDVCRRPAAMGLRLRNAPGSGSHGPSPRSGQYGSDSAHHPRRHGAILARPDRQPFWSRRLVPRRPSPDAARRRAWQATGRVGV